MSATSDPILSDEIEAAVRAVPGVVNVYPTGSPVTVILTAAVRSIGLAKGPPAVVVEGDEHGVRIALSLGVDGRIGAAATIRAAHEAVSHVVSARGGQVLHARITVAHIAETTDHEGDAPS